jgi:hypothetical protein
MSQFRITKDAAGHWLVVSGPTEKPVAVFYAHNVPEHIAHKRAEKFIKAMR